MQQTRIHAVAPLLAYVCCGIVCVAWCRGADAPKEAEVVGTAPYQVWVHTQRAQGPTGKPEQQTLVRVTVLKTPNDPRAKWQVLSRPSVLIEDGQRAVVEVGDSSRATGKKSPALRAEQPVPATQSGPAEAWSGVRIDLVRPQEPAKVIVVVTVWNDGSIVWANTDAINVGKDTPVDPAVLKRLREDSR